MTTPGDPSWGRQEPDASGWQRQHWEPGYGPYRDGSRHGPQQRDPSDDGGLDNGQPRHGRPAHVQPQYGSPDHNPQPYGQQLYGQQLYGRLQDPDFELSRPMPVEQLPVQPPRRRGRRPWIAGLALGAVVLVGAAALAWHTTDGDDGARAVSRPSGGATMPSAVPVAVPNMIPRRPAVNPTYDGRPGPVAGPTFAAADSVHQMDLAGLPFTFDVPTPWSCKPSDKLRAGFLVAWTCYDVDDARGAGGMVAVRTCTTPCADADRSTLRSLLPVDASDWRQIDPTTSYSEESGALTVGANAGEQVERVAMTFTFASTTGGPLDTMAFAQFTGPTGSKSDMQKVINDIRLRAAG